MERDLEAGGAVDARLTDDEPVDNDETAHVNRELDEQDTPAVLARRAPKAPTQQEIDDHNTSHEPY